MHHDLDKKKKKKKKRECNDFSYCLVFSKSFSTGLSNFSMVLRKIQYRSKVMGVQPGGQPGSRGRHCSAVLQSPRFHLGRKMKIFPRWVLQQLAGHRASLLSAVSGERQESPKAGNIYCVFHHGAHTPWTWSASSTPSLPDLFKTGSKNSPSQHRCPQECLCAHKWKQRATTSVLQQQLACTENSFILFQNRKLQSQSFLLPLILLFKLVFESIWITNLFSPNKETALPSSLLNRH